MSDLEQYIIKPKTVSDLKPMDWCLMRDTLCEASDTWELCQYAYTERFMVSDTEERPYYHAVGGLHYDECIPYNDQTAHLLGTKEDKSNAKD